jgi:hypothetical protein
MIQWAILAAPLETVKQLSVLIPITLVPLSSIREHGNGEMNQKNESQKSMLVIFIIRAITSLPLLFLVFGTRKASVPQGNYFFRDFLHRYADIPVALSEGKFSRRRRGYFEFNKKGIVEIGVTCKFM